MLNTFVSNARWRYSKAIIFLAALACACIVFGAIPWVSVPTQGQALWASGFAQSYANAGGFAIYATEFGLPNPAPIAFGLSAAFVQGLVIRFLGIAAIDAYTVTTLLYLALALQGAILLARSFGASYALSILSGLLWLVYPAVCKHAGYSALALGFALLPSYLYIANRLLIADNRRAGILAAVFFGITCVIAVFMDGYTFMMFFVASMLLWCVKFATDRVARIRSLCFALPCLCSGFSLAYVLYTSFIGLHDYAEQPIAMFRAMGVDVEMLLVPSRGALWLWDTLGISVARGERIFWGDESVWLTTFVLPLLATGLMGYALARDRVRALALLVLAAAGLYLSLGPSLKIHSTKLGTTVSATDNTYLMPEKYARMPTGSAWLSKDIPGFSQMRASYRWIGLGALGLWGLSILLLVRIHDRRPTLAYAIALLLIACFVPDVRRILQAASINRANAYAIGNALTSDLRGAAGDHGTIFFAPYGNDFIVPYLAATGGFKTYNIGGDKNVEIAWKGWNESLRNLDGNSFASKDFSSSARSILLTGQAHAIVFTYFDQLAAANVWPQSDSTLRELQAQRLPVARSIAAAPCFQLQEFSMFAAVSLTETGRREQALLANNNSDQRTDREVANICRLMRE